MSGASGKTTMTVTVSTNGSESERRAEVNIACGSVSKSFSVVQEGKAPVTSEPTLFNVTNPEESGITVVSYDPSKRELLMNVPEDRIPKVGDIICSGRSKEAPFGFLGEVGSVTVSDTRAGEDLAQKYVRAGFVTCSLYTLFQKLGVEEKRWLSLGKADVSFTDDAGHSIEPIKDKDGVDLVSIHLPIKIHDDVKIDYTYEVSVPRCSVYVDTKTINLVFGYDVVIKESELLHVKAGFNLPFHENGEVVKDLGWDRPSFVHVYDIQLGPIPVVITTQYMMTIPYEISLSAYLDMDIHKRVTYHHMGGYYYCATNTMVPLDGSTSFSEVIEGDDEGDYQQEYSDREFSATLDGKLSVGVDFGWSVGLYGGNLDDDGDISTGLNYLSAGANGGMKVSNKFSLGGLINADEDSHNGVRIIDDLTSTASAYGKIWGTAISTDVLGAEIQLTAAKDWDFYKKELYSSFFFPYYSKLKVTSITRQNFLNVTGRKHKPLFRGLLSVFKETDYGLCLESFDGNDYRVFSLAGHPIDDTTRAFSFDIPLDVSNLRRNVKYSVYPYSKVTNFLLMNEEKMVCRKGVSFTISDDGQLSTATIDDVPGEQL